MTHRQSPAEVETPGRSTPLSPRLGAAETATSPPAQRPPRVLDARHLTLSLSARWRSRLALPSIALPLALVLAMPALAADWLVLRDGDRLQVTGSWHVEGSQVKFTLANGTLASLPTAAVDLRESRRVAVAPTAGGPRSLSPAPNQAAWVLTDADVRHIRASGTPIAAAPSPAVSDRRPRSAPGPLSTTPSNSALRRPRGGEETSRPAPRPRRFVSPPLSLEQAVALMKELETEAERVCITDESQSTSIVCSGGSPTAVRALPASPGAAL